MARPPKPINHLPVSQRELANYLGISPTMLNLAEGKQLSRSLPAGLSEKLTALAVDHENIKKRKRPQRSLAKSQPRVSRQAAVLASKMSTDMHYYSAKAKFFQAKLDEMLNKYKEDMQWMDTIEDRLEAFAGKKEPKREYLWFRNQHALVSERLERTGIAAQVKLEMQVELAKAKAGINKALLRKLKKENN